MRLPPMKRYADFDNFMDQAVPAVQAQHKGAERKLRDEEHAKEFEALFGDQVLAVYQRSTPTEKERSRHYKRFRAFQTWTGESGCRTAVPLPAYIF